jgi:hypothetical protein
VLTPRADRRTVKADAKLLPGCAWPLAHLVPQNPAIRTRIGEVVLDVGREVLKHGERIGRRLVAFDPVPPRHRPHRDHERRVLGLRLGGQLGEWHQ